MAFFENRLSLTAMFVFAILILGIATVGFPNSAISNTNDVRRYSDSELSELNVAGYSEGRGECVKDPGSVARCEIYLKFWLLLINSRPKKYVFGIQTRLGRDSRGYPIYRRDDALEYS